MEHRSRRGISGNPGDLGNPGDAGNPGDPGAVGGAAAVAVPPPPAGAAAWFADALPALECYADLLAGQGVLRGLLGPREVPRLWERHLLNCAVLAPLPPSRAVCADVGSGAGLPGLVVALLRPDLRLTLVEPLLRRTGFLEEALAELRLTDRVDVARARAQDVAPASYDVVMARAVAPLGRLVGWCLPLLVPGGELLALKGARARAELAAAQPELCRYGETASSVEELGTGLGESSAAVVRVRVGTARRSAAPTRDRTQRTARRRPGGRPAQGST